MDGRPTSPLLDEAAELLGEDDAPRRRGRGAADAERRAEVEYAAPGAGHLRRRGLQSAPRSWPAATSAAARSGSVAERAGADRSWAFGHVVVDEAQELSPMAWRLLMRRCPRRSFTVVGDVAQTGSAGRRDVVGRRARARTSSDRWTQAELTVNYRTPEQVMDLAAGGAGRGGSPVARADLGPGGPVRAGVHRVPDGAGPRPRALADDRRAASGSRPARARSR